MTGRVIFSLGRVDHPDCDGTDVRVSAQIWADTLAIDGCHSSCGCLELKVDGFKLPREEADAALEIVLEAEQKLANLPTLKRLREAAEEILK